MDGTKKNTEGERRSIQKEREKGGVNSTKDA